MEIDLIQSGVDLMLYGMGTVFVFLTVLVFSTSIMSYLVNRFLPEAAPAQASISRSMAKPSPNLSSLDGRTLKIIQEAIYQHRANNK